jgi:hypothetical protein
VFQYITSASEVQNETVISNAIVEGQRITTIQQSYFFVLWNGMMELLTGSLDISDSYYKFHLERMVYYERNFLIMMICGILFTVIS